MAKFVQRCPIPVDLIAVRLLRRHLNIILRGHVERLIAPDPEIRAGRRNQRLGLWDQFAFRQRLARFGGDGPRYPFALLQIEDGEALEESNLPLLLALQRQLHAIVALRRETIGIENRRPAFALADIAAKVLRLPVGDPALRPETPLGQGVPKDQHIDPG